MPTLRPEAVSFLPARNESWAFPPTGDTAGTGETAVSERPTAGSSERPSGAQAPGTGRAEDVAAGRVGGDVEAARAAGVSLERDGFARPYLVAVTYGSATYGFLAVLLSGAVARRIVADWQPDY